MYCLRYSNYNIHILATHRNDLLYFLRQTYSCVAAVMRKANKKVDVEQVHEGMRRALRYCADKRRDSKCRSSATLQVKLTTGNHRASSSSSSSSEEEGANA